MALAHQRPAIEARAPGSPRDAARPRVNAPAGPTRADALGRIASKVSGRRDVARLFDDIIDEAFGLFGVDQIAISWPRALGIVLLGVGAALSLAK